MVALVKVASPTGHYIHDFTAEGERNINDRLDSLKQRDRFKLNEGCELSFERQITKLFLQVFGCFIRGLRALCDRHRTQDKLASTLDLRLTGEPLARRESLRTQTRALRHS